MSNVRHIKTIISAEADKASLNEVSQQFKNALTVAPGSMRALEGINTVRAAERAYNSQRQAQRAIAEAQAASRRLYDFAGNPFLVVSNLTSSISGIKQIRNQLEQSADMIRRGTQDAKHYRKQLKDLADAGIDKSAPLYKENARYLREANKERREGIALQKEGAAKTKGMGFVARSIADFGLQQLATGAMFTFAFQGAAMVMEALAGAAVQFGKDLLDPLNRARDAAKELVDVIKNAGGTERFGLLFGLTTDEVAALKRLSAASTAEQTAKDLAVYEKQVSEAGLAGTSVDQALVQAAVDEVLKSRQGIRAREEALSENTWSGMKQWEYAVTRVMAESSAWFNSLGVSSKTTAEERRSALETVGETEVRRAILPIFDALKAGSAITNEMVDKLRDVSDLYGMGNNALLRQVELIQRRNLLEQRSADVQDKLKLGLELALLTGKRSDIFSAFPGGISPLANYRPSATSPMSMIDPASGQLLAGAAAQSSIADFTDQASIDLQQQVAKVGELFDATTRLNGLQTKAANLQISASWGAIALQRAQIKAGVAKSMVGQVGMSIFDLAAQIAEARAQARIQMRQLNAQAAQLAMQKKIATASEAVRKLNTDESVVAVQKKIRAAYQKDDNLALASAINLALSGDAKKTLVEALAEALAKKLSPAP